MYLLLLMMLLLIHCKGSWLGRVQADVVTKSKESTKKEENKSKTESRPRTMGLEGVNLRREAPECNRSDFYAIDMRENPTSKPKNVVCTPGTMISATQRRFVHPLDLRSPSSTNLSY